MEREQMTAEQKQQIVEHFQLFEKASKSLFKNPTVNQCRDEGVLI